MARQWSRTRRTSANRFSIRAQKWPTAMSRLCRHSTVCWTRLRSSSSSRTLRLSAHRSTCRQQIPVSLRFLAQFGAVHNDAWMRGALRGRIMTAILAPPEPSYLDKGHDLRSWLLTTDHKRIGILYMISITLMFALGGIAATLMRLELLTPRGDMVDANTYNKLFTIHGVIMVWFFLIPSIPTVLGNFLVPLMLGARDVAFPRLNLASWYIFVLGSLFTLWAIVTGGVDTGWTFYTPYSTAASSGKVISTTLGVFIVGFSSILTGLNFIVTVHRMRAPGMTWFRLPLFIWSTYATSVIMILATP